MLRFINLSPTANGRRFAFVGRAGQYLLVDVGATNSEEWSSQFPGECRWFPFEPNAVERAVFARSRFLIESAMEVGGRDV